MEPGREDREHQPQRPALEQQVIASMEPGREDREHHALTGEVFGTRSEPQWNPVAKTGSTLGSGHDAAVRQAEPQWNPVAKTGSTVGGGGIPEGKGIGPQWNPVAKTGSTSGL